MNCSGRRVGSALMLCTLLAACSSSAPEDRTSLIEESGLCDGFNVRRNGGLGFDEDGNGQPIDENDPKLGYEHVLIHDCAVQLVMPTQAPAKDQYGRKLYRLYQDGSDTPLFVGEQELPAFQWIQWDRGTVRTRLLESEWIALPTHAFQCAPTETDMPKTPYTCEGTVVRGIEASTYEGIGWDISGGLSSPEVKGVTLKFSGSKSGKTEHTIEVKQRLAPDLVWADKYPVVFNAVLTRKDKRLQTGVGRPCYRQPDWCLDTAELEVVVTTTTLVSTRTNNWDQLMAHNGDWRKTIARGKYAGQPFKPGSPPTFSTVLPDRPMREEISGSVRALTASWEKKHTYMNKSDVSTKGEADLTLVTAAYGQTTSKAYGDGTSTAVDMKYTATDGTLAMCLTLMEIVREEAPFITGISLEGCR